MFDRDLRKKRRAVTSARRTLDQAYEAAEQKGLTGEELVYTVEEWWVELTAREEEYKSARDERLVDQAQRFELPTPVKAETSPEWKQGFRYRSLWHLTDSAHNDLRAAIRAEKLERNDVWVRFAVVATGLVAAGTGVAAVVVAALR